MMVFSCFVSIFPVAATVSCVRKTVAISENRLSANALVSPKMWNIDMEFKGE